MRTRIPDLFCLLITVLLITNLAQAQQTKVYRIGVLVPGEAWYEVVDGLRVGLKELGLQEEKQFVLSIQDWKGNAKRADEAARKFEQEKAALIYTTSTNSTLAAKRATAEIPIVFCAGTAPLLSDSLIVSQSQGEDSQAFTFQSQTLLPSVWKSSKRLSQSSVE